MHMAGVWEIDNAYAWLKDGLDDTYGL